jgi:hypothetical protein
MDRRAFLKTVAVGAGAAGAGSCAHLSSPLLTTNADVLALVDELKQRLTFLSSPAGVEELRAKAPADAPQAPGFDQDLALFGDGIQALTLAGAFHGMSEEVRAHPAVQQLMFDSAPQLGDTAKRLHRVALDTTPEQQRELTLRLREDPTLLDQAGSKMEAMASELGVSVEQRARLRALLQQVGNRMKQSTPLMLEEYGRKVRAIEDRLAEPRGFEREAIARMGEVAFWDYHQRLQQYASAWGGPVASPQDLAPGTPTTPPLPPVGGEAPPAQVARPADAGVEAESDDDAPPKSRPGEAGTKAGLIMLAAGFGIGAIGAVMAILGGGINGGVGMAGLFVATAGALLVIAALITLLVSAIIRGAAAAKEAKQ